MIKTVMFFKNGNTAVFDDRGQQATHLQKSWLLMYMKHLRDHEVDVGLLEVLLPDGRHAEILDGGENWRILE